MEIFDPAKFDTKFNQVEHTMELYLDNSDNTDGDVYKYPINPNSVVNFSIEETLADWVAKGTLTFFYSPELGSNYMDPNTGQTSDTQTGIGGESKPFFQFRGDGNDRLRLRITPNLNDGGPGDSGISITDRKHWTLSYLFSIYDMEDIDQLPGANNQASSTLKCLKLYFWDEWYQKMITNIIEYSTATSGNMQKKPTGLAMKEIIETALEGIPSTKGAPTGEWENGSTEVFFTSPTQVNSYDSLMYVYDRHLSNESLSINGLDVYDFSLLTKERGPEENGIGQLTLRPLSQYFKKAGKDADSPGEYQIEHFFLQAYGDSSNRPKQFRAPMSKDKSDKVDFKSFKYGAITSYRFVDISAITNATKFCSMPTYSFDFAKRQYNVEFKTPNVKTAREFIAKKYINELYKGGGDPEKLFLINLEENKQTNKNIKPIFSLYGDDPIARQADNLQKLLHLGVFQNTCINFRTLGLTNREPGRFIAIDKTEGVDPGDFQDKFYGQWFVIHVKHVFETELFYNEITAVKIHRFNETKNGVPNTF